MYARRTDTEVTPLFHVAPHHVMDVKLEEEALDVSNIDS